MGISDIDLIAGWASLVLTLMIFSYILADNVLYRLAVHVLVGAAAGYAAIAAAVDVIIPWFDSTLADTEDSAVLAFGLIPLLIALFLLLKLTPRYAYVGNGGLLFVMAVGVGVAIVGAIQGTIIPLVRETGESLDTEKEQINGILLVLGTTTTLIYFQYLSRQNAVDGIPRNRFPIRSLRYIGQGFISVTLGALYAQAILTSLVIVNDLIRTHIDFLLGQFGG